MSQGSSTVPPPPTGDPNQDIQGAGNGGGMDKVRSLITKLSGGGTPAIDAALKQHHDQVVADAQRHSETAKRYYGMLTQAKITGKNPLTGQPVTPEELATWQQQADGAWADYTKIAGKSKAAKPIIQQMGGLLGHLTGKHPGGGSTGPAAAGSSQGGPPAAPGGPSQQGTPTVPPPPQAAASPSAPSPTVPPPPGAPDSLAGPTMDKMTKEQDELRVAGGKKQAEETATITGMAEGLKSAGFTPEQIREVIKSKVGGAGARAKAMHPLKVSNPDGTQVPALQDPVTGEVFGPDGNKIDNPVVVPVGLMPTERTGEMPVFNPVTNQFEQQPTHSSSRKVMPGGSATKGGGSAAGGSGSKPSGAGGGTPSSSSGRHGIPARQFNILQKQATAIDEARNSLIGDDPKNPNGGLMADLHVFDNPESVRKISEYLGLVNSQIANEAKSVAGQGAWAAAEWYLGLPQAVIGLQQGALADASRGLTGDEQRFVADYYRTLGTIGGMRAATGASSAQWSYNTLRGELPTPGPVTNRKEAARRINNFIQETNVVSKRNPLLAPAATRPSTVPPPPSGGDDVIYATDPAGKVHKAKKGTPLPQGWKPTNAPTGTQ